MPVVQLANTLGAGGGGLLFEAGAYRATFLASAIVLALGAIFAANGSRHAVRARQLNAAVNFTGTVSAVAE